MNEEFKNYLLTELKNGVKKSTLKNIVKDNLGCGKTKAYEILNALAQEVVNAFNNPTPDYASDMEDFNEAVNKEVLRVEADKRYKSLIEPTVGWDGNGSPTDETYNVTYDVEQKQGQIPAPLLSNLPEPDMVKRGDDEWVHVSVCGEKDIKIPIINEKQEEGWEKALEFTEKYIYNKESDKYVFPTKRVKSGNIVLSGTKLRAIQADFSNFDGKELTITEVSRKYQIPRNILEDVLKRIGCKHDSLPFTDEEVRLKSEDELAEDLLEAKKFSIMQKLEKEEWKSTQTLAAKWTDYKTNILDPFEAFLKDWKPPEYKPISRLEHHTNKPATRQFVVGAFDWHVGALSEERYLHNPKQQGWNIEAAKKSIRTYLEKISTRVGHVSFDYTECVLLMGGDLLHSLTGFTDKGTPLVTDRMRDTQFDALMDSLVLFISGLFEIFGKLRIEFVRGNHTGTVDYPMAIALKSYFRTEENITFNIYSTQTAYVRVGPVLMLLDHGAHDLIKSLMPRDTKAREAHILSRLIDRPELLQDVKQHIFVMGDQHHYVQKEYANFEFFQFGALPASDYYAEAKGLGSRPRQNCLIVGPSGVEEVHHYYLD